MADIGTVTVNLSPTIDTDALAASIRTAVADAFEQVAAELRAEVPATRWTIGQELTAADLDLLPVGAVVVDGDNDKSVKHPDGTPWFSREVRRWSRDDVGPGATLPSSIVADYPPVTLVSLP